METLTRGLDQAVGSIWGAGYFSEALLGVSEGVVRQDLVRSSFSRKSTKDKDPTQIFLELASLNASDQRKVLRGVALFSIGYLLAMACQTWMLFIPQS